MDEFGELEITEPHRLPLKQKLKDRQLSKSIACIVEIHQI